MTAYLFDFVNETTTTTGNGTYSLAGAVAGFRSFASAAGSGATVYYAVFLGANWETGYGVVTAGTPDTLTRAAILGSSNGGSAVNWGAGTKNVFSATPGPRSLVLTPAGALDLTGLSVLGASLTTPALGTPSSGTLTNCAGLPISTGVSGMGSGVAAFLATPSSANLAAAVTGETGSGALVFGTAPTLVAPKANVTSVAYASSVTLDFAQGPDFVVGAMTGPMTLANPSNVAVGQGGVIKTSENATGGYALSMGSNWVRVGSAAQNTAANKRTLIAYSVPFSTTEIFYSFVPEA